MCRVAAFVPGMSREEAVDILLAMEKSNTHGTGYAYAKDGKLVINKFPVPLSKVVKKLGKNFLGHMPCDSYTIAHLRLASHGAILHENCHPFNLENNWAFIHNGVFSEYKMPRLILQKHIKLEGNTDTIVAGHIYNTIGPKKFIESIDTSGVFMALHKNGNLNVMMTSGDLVFQKRENNTYLLASELPSSYEYLEGIKGWYKFNRDGTFNKWVKKIWNYNNYSNFKSEELTVVKDSPPGEEPRTYFYTKTSSPCSGGSSPYSNHLPVVYRGGITDVLTAAEREELEKELERDYTITSTSIEPITSTKRNEDPQGYGW